MAEQATNVIYKLAEHPDTICSTILKRVAKVVVNQSGATADQGMVSQGGATADQGAQEGAQPPAEDTGEEQGGWSYSTSTLEEVVAI